MIPDGTLTPSRLYLRPRHLGGAASFLPFVALSRVNAIQAGTLDAPAALLTQMTTEYHIFQKLGSGPVALSVLSDIEADDLEDTMQWMVGRRQICVRNGQVALFWHRHLIARAAAMVPDRALLPV